jgi:hypothetical protein
MGRKPLLNERETIMRYQVTKSFIAGILKGQQVTEITNVPFKLGKEYKSCVNSSIYLIVDVKRLTT